VCAGEDLEQLTNTQAEAQHTLNFARLHVCGASSQLWH